MIHLLLKLELNSEFFLIIKKVLHNILNDMFYSKAQTGNKLSSIKVWRNILKESFLTARHNKASNPELSRARQFDTMGTSEPFFLSNSSSNALKRTWHSRFFNSQRGEVRWVASVQAKRQIWAKLHSTVEEDKTAKKTAFAVLPFCKNISSNGTSLNFTLAGIRAQNFFFCISQLGISTSFDN